MSRFLLSGVVVLVMLAAAPAANAELTNLYNSMQGEQTVQGINNVPVGPSDLGTFRAATSFVPTRSGEASVVSMRGQCVIPYPQGTVCEGIGEVSIQADKNGRPSGVSLGTMGFYLTDSLSNGNPVKRECGRESARLGHAAHGRAPPRARCFRRAASAPHVIDAAGRHGVCPMPCACSRCSRSSPATRSS